jgi:hypothetical protein
MALYLLVTPGGIACPWCRSTHEWPNILVGQLYHTGHGRRLVWPREKIDAVKCVSFEKFCYYF